METTRPNLATRRRAFIQLEQEEIMAAKPKKEKEQVYLVPVTWTMTGHYAIKAMSDDEAAEKSRPLALPDDGVYLNDSCEVVFDEVAPITPEFAHLKVYD
jgi:hypothetical protein